MSHQRILTGVTVILELGMIDNCGLAQIFDFTVDGEKIWFTEWVENNIGVVDTSVPLPMKIQLDSDTLILAPGETQTFQLYCLT